MLRKKPEYTIVLGLSDRGRTFLASARKRDGGPVISVAQSSSELDMYAEKARFADKLYALTAGFSPDYFIKKHPFINGIQSLAQ